MAGRGRPAGFVMGPEHRTKIANSRIFGNLLKVAEGEMEISLQAERVSLALLKKIMPDLQATSFSDTSGNDARGKLTIEIVTDDDE